MTRASWLTRAAGVERTAVSEPVVCAVQWPGHCRTDCSVGEVWGAR